jgi:hypothetical protein
MLRPTNSLVAVRSAMRAAISSLLDSSAMILLLFSAEWKVVRKFSVSGSLTLQL